MDKDQPTIGQAIRQALRPVIGCLLLIPFVLNVAAIGMEIFWATGSILLVAVFVAVLMAAYVGFFAR